ncbi:MAG: hypothetical protein WC205_00790 [Opitutaceae bacterium]|jgi:hypothetical protein
MKTKLLLMGALWAGFAMVSARADVGGSLSVEIRIGKALPPPPPEVVVVEESGPPGPPPWAAHRWFRRERVYYYYTDGNVYYRPADRTWFYLDGGEWRMGVNLPDRIQFEVGHSVRLTMETDRPFIYHEQVVAHYPSGYFNKVRIKGDHDDAPGKDRDRKHDNDGDDHDQGNSHGKGKGKDKGRD